MTDAQFDEIKRLLELLLAQLVALDREILHIRANQERR